MVAFNPDNDLSAEDVTLNRSSRELDLRAGEKKESPSSMPPPPPGAVSERSRFGVDVKNGDLAAGLPKTLPEGS